ncbi:MAG: hypothetical protein CVU50_09765 [Candidatus Cloacimonetes bacterium HGW-Cloacimonetes-3]|jgi:hypothetical protein|nr:MAG: hypothetical protein CVU50_09765 [Candidatus Cloacimonetes bacterium HGW-Cloacimonetes-3]
MFHNGLDDNLLAWLLQGDVSIQYQVYRDLLETEKPELWKAIHTEGWAKQFLELQQENGHWGLGWYRPKWTCTHYTLLMLKYLQPIKDIPSITSIVNQCLDKQKCADGGFSFWKDYKHSDICVDGMVLNYASYFVPPDKRMNSVIDMFLSSQMQDGGWNCRYLHKAVHGSFHTSLSVLEGLWEYRQNGGTYRLAELTKAENKCIEFLMVHHLYLSHQTMEPVDYKMSLFSYPPHWHYDVLKALYHLAERKLSYDPRLKEALELLKHKRDAEGKWKLQNRHAGAMLFHMEKVGHPSRWNTLRALRVLAHFNPDM